MQTEALKVTGMTCGGCAGKVTRALKAVAGAIEISHRGRGLQCGCRQTRAGPPGQGLLLRLTPDAASGAQ